MSFKFYQEVLLLCVCKAVEKIWMRIIGCFSSYDTLKDKISLFMVHCNRNRFADVRKL